MIKSRRWIAAMLTGSLALGMLTGCGGDKDIAGNVKLENGEIQENSLVIAVGDIGVKYNEVLGYCYLLKEQYEDSVGSEIWDYQLEEGKTIGDEAKEEVINMITQLKIIGATAEDEEVSLTNDEKDEALRKAEELLSNASDEDKEKYHLSVQGMSEIYEENALANKMFYIATDDADTEVSDEEARQIKLEFFEIITKGTTKSGTVVELDAEEKSAARERANDLRKQAAKSEDFLSFAKEKTDGEVVSMTIGQDNTTLDRSVVTTAFSMEEGDISPVIGTDSGYYVLRCADANDEDATYARKEEIIEERQTRMFKEKYKEWLGEWDVEISSSFWLIFEI